MRLRRQGLRESYAVTCAVTLIRDVAKTLDLRGVRDIFRFRPRPPRFTLQKSQPMRLAFLFPVTNSPRVRSISGLLLFAEIFPHFSPCW